MSVNFNLTIICVHIPITLFISVHLFQRTITVCYINKTSLLVDCYFLDSYCEVRFNLTSGLVKLVELGGHFLISGMNIIVGLFML